jgi:hypothetical protein
LGKLGRLRMVEIVSAPAQLKETLTALVQLRSKEIGKVILTHPITYPVKSGSVREVNQLNEKMP